MVFSTWINKNILSLRIFCLVLTSLRNAKLIVCLQQGLEITKQTFGHRYTHTLNKNHYGTFKYQTVFYWHLIQAWGLLAVVAKSFMTVWDCRQRIESAFVVIKSDASAAYQRGTIISDDSAQSQGHNGGWLIVTKIKHERQQRVGWRRAMTEWGAR